MRYLKFFLIIILLSNCSFFQSREVEKIEFSSKLGIAFLPPSGKTVNNYENVFEKKMRFALDRDRDFLLQRKEKTVNTCKEMNYLLPKFFSEFEGQVVGENLGVDYISTAQINNIELKEVEKYEFPYVYKTKKMIFEINIDFIVLQVQNGNYIINRNFTRQFEHSTQKEVFDGESDTTIPISVEEKDSFINKCIEEMVTDILKSSKEALYYSLKN